MSGIRISEADRLFSLVVRSRAKWTCERCWTKYEPPTQALHCSHFHGRGKRSVRFDFENACALCYGCHRHLGSNPEKHRAFWLKRLGQAKFDLLLVRANTPQKNDEKLVRVICRKLLADFGYSHLI